MGGVQHIIIANTYTQPRLTRVCLWLTHQGLYIYARMRAEHLVLQRAQYQAASYTAASCSTSVAQYLLISSISLSPSFKKSTGLASITVCLRRRSPWYSRLLWWKE
jgi:hypothetical protein